MENKKIKVNIIGAGVSGLCAGSYLQMNGFETEIFEKHSIPGGLCTSWKKGDYTIDGCLHWILGSKKGSGFYNYWSELLDLKKIPFHDHDVRMHVEVKHTRDKYGDNTFHLYTNLDKLQAYMLDLAPEDSKVIKKFIRQIRILQTFELPPLLDEIPLIPSIIRSIKMSRYLRFLLLILKLNKVTNRTMARQFKNPFLKESFELLFDGEEVKMLVLAFPMASFDQKSAGYPIGGSLSWAQRLADRYTELGGKIHYNTPVKKIITENNEARALLVRNNVIHPSDITLSAADWHHTLFDFLDGKYVDKTILELRSEKKLDLFYSVLLVSFGVNRTFEGEPHFLRFPIRTKLESPCGTNWERLEVHLYNYDPTMAPEGKTMLACSFYTKNGKYWIDLRKNDRPKYREAKTKFCQDVLDRLEEKYPGIKSQVEVMDFATPATVLRYTNNWQGSTQGWLPSDNFAASSPVGFKLPGLRNFYYASHWNRPGGGLPIAITAARDVAKTICKDCKVKFVTPPNRTETEP
ncbi:MAG: NAD(P)/FAD-dependent oxidoreductase [Bacteroidetes bacterium]|nr:NAD(P)/FAD-dependent oxidoreductase [Bacteroidota bacterium]